VPGQVVSGRKKRSRQSWHAWLPPLSVVRKIRTVGAF